MKKIALLLSLVLFYSLSMAQVSEPEKNAALNVIRLNKATIGLTVDDINETSVSNTYVDKSTGIRYVYLQQTHKGILVYNQFQVLSFRGDKLLSKTGTRIPFIEQKVNSKSGIPSITAQAALAAVFADRKVKTAAIPALKNSRDNNRKLVFEKKGLSKFDITANLMWVPDTKSDRIHLVWQVFVAPETTPDGWLVTVDALNNYILNVKNYTNYDHWEKPGSAVKQKKQNAQLQNHVTTGNAVAKINTAVVNPAGQVNASYRVIPFPAENPLAPGGTPALVTNPWLMVPGDATSLKWHTGLGGTTYNYTRGNNVWAYQDRESTDLPGIDKSVNSSITGALTFDFTPDFTVDPAQTSPVPNQQFAVTNLFYWNNIIHDVMYQYGFTEAAANFQADNLERGGEGNDHINAEAQDGSGLNNANFLTPPDGIPGRMQMYLFSPPLVAPTLTVNSPAAIAGGYHVNSLSPLSLLMNLGALTGELVHYNDDETGSTHLACNAVAANNLSGKIALIKRGGNCTFVTKILNAQSSGAIAVILYNNVPGDFGTALANSNITIPAVAISGTDGEKLAANLEEGISVTLSAYPVSNINRDSDLDNGIVVHEYAHGISNRLTGGGISSCLFNGEQMGEGWSDYYALMFTQDWANATLNTGFTEARAMGAYALNKTAGYRQSLYSANFDVNPQVYATSIPGNEQQHARGEIWCAALWDMTWAIIQQEGSINPNIADPAGGGGNTIAMKLVTEGMKLQPCSPGFIDGRDAIILADINLYGGKHVCTIIEAFRKRGMGLLATQGSSEDVNDQLPSFEEVTPVWVLDADDDNYFTGEPVPGCSWPGAGWVIATNQQPGDCDDNDPLRNAPTPAAGIATGSAEVVCPGAEYTLSYSGSEIGALWQKFDNEMGEWVNLGNADKGPLKLIAQQTINFNGLTYRVFVPNGNCYAVSNEIKIAFIGPEPIIKAPPQICPGSGEIELTVTERYGNALSSIVWSPGGQTTPTINVNADLNRQFSVTVTSLYGCTATVTKGLELVPDAVPLITSSAGSAVCAGTAVTLAFTGTNTTPGCTSGTGPWPEAAYNFSNCNGQIEQIVTDGWAGEYSAVNVQAGKLYIFFSLDENAVNYIGDNITITDEIGGRIFSTGLNYVYYIPDSSRTIRFYTHEPGCIAKEQNRQRWALCSDDIDKWGFFWLPGGATTHKITVNPSVNSTYSLSFSNIDFLQQLNCGAGTATQQVQVTALTKWYKDADNDEYSDGTIITQCTQPAGYKLASALKSISGDCDDANPVLNPSTAWYKDSDDDGYSSGDVLVQCNRPPFYKLATELTAIAGDCIDNNPSVNPGAVEVCRNGIDDNCNGVIDEGACAPCGNATSLITINITTSGATLAWSAVANPDQWQVQYKTTKKGSKWVDVFVTGNKRSVTLNGLLADQNYSWQIRAKCGRSWTDYSTPVAFKTTGLTSTVEAKKYEIVESETFEVITAPNPSDSYFTLTVKSSNTTDRILVRVMDELGRVVEQKENVMSGTTIRFGDTYIPGMYFIMVQQGKNSKAVKLIRR